MVVDTACCALNVVLDYAWIFGRFGFPAFGIAGAAWATVVSQWSAAAMYWLIVQRPHRRRGNQLAIGCRYDAALMRRLLRFGGPNGLQYLTEVAAFTLFLLLVGTLGKDALAATNLAFHINTLAWAPMLGMATAVSTIVGQRLGRSQAELAARATWTGFWIALIYVGAIAMLYVVAPDLLLLGHAAGAPPDRFQSLRSLTVVLLQFVAAYCLFDAMNLIFASAIKGAGDTRFVLATTLLLSPLPVVASGLGMAWFGAGILWCWSAATLWVCLLGLTYLARFLQGRWRQMRVIEPDLLGMHRRGDEPPTVPAPVSAADPGAVLHIPSSG
jgi:MATE family multidrug resistance protein